MNNHYSQKRSYFQNQLNKETLAAQEAFAQSVASYCNAEPEEVYGEGHHAHKCLFCMLTNDKPQQLAQCKKWRRDHHITAPFDKMEWSDACDHCIMMCYLALDDEEKLMWATR